MTTGPPPPGSAWARHCPDAYPADWFAALGLSALPAGFARFATDAECELIAGRAEPPSPAPLPPPEKPGRRGRDRGGRFAVLNAFTDCTLAGLTGAEAKVWLILFRDTKAATGTARTGQADLARRAGLSVRGVQLALTALAAKGLVSVVRRGRLNDGPSTYRVHPTGPGDIPPAQGGRDARPGRVH